MRYVTIPAAIKPLNNKGEAEAQPIPFVTFLEVVMFDDQRAGSTYKTLLRWKGVVAKYKAAKEGDTIAFEDQDWELQEKIMQAPERHFNAQLGVQLLPFYEAVINAPKELPKSDDLVDDSVKTGT